jgi:hypothetical protein
MILSKILQLLRREDIGEEMNVGGDIQQKTRIERCNEVNEYSSTYIFHTFIQQNEMLNGYGLAFESSSRMIKKNHNSNLPFNVTVSATVSAA